MEIRQKCGLRPYLLNMLYSVSVQYIGVVEGTYAPML
jgi:hypothetical protein